MTPLPLFCLHSVYRLTLYGMAALLLALTIRSAAAQSSFIGRPIYSEPGAGLQMPPGCQVDPTWRSRLERSDLEVWIVECHHDTRTWLMKRSTIQVISNNQARLRFQVLDERSWPGESPGESASVQCVGKSSAATNGGFVVLGAKWKPVGSELRLSGAQTVIRADSTSQRFVDASLTQVDCVRYPAREAMLRQLGQKK